MAADPKADNVPKARALYAAGSSLSAAAAALGVSESTVRRWARKDRAAGRPWQREAPPAALTVQEAPAPPEAPASPACRRKCGARPDRAELCRRLEERLARVIDEQAEGAAAARMEDRMLKICRVLEYLRGDADPVAEHLGVSKPTAANAIAVLGESGVLREITGRQRDRAYAYDAYLRVLAEDTAGGG